MTTSGQWGSYAVADGQTSGPVGATGHARNAVFLAEGLYTGAAPTVDIATLIGAGGTAVNFWNATGFPNQGSSTVSAGGGSNALAATNPFVPEPATLTLVGLAVVGFGGLVGRRRS